jgi:hypothetical protein
MCIGGGGCTDRVTMCTCSALDIHDVRGQPELTHDR